MSYSQQSPQSVRDLFSSIASDYDRGNKTLSFNLHLHWNRKLAQSVAKKASEGNYLDLCAGTGDIAFMLHSLGVHPKNAWLLDFCPEMLQIAKSKCPTSFHPTYLTADASAIPLPSTSFDAVTIAYGIRNVASPTSCFSEVFRILKPSGELAILELTRPSSPLVRFCHTLYLTTLLPLLGRLITRNGAAYSYLSSTIRSFSSPAALASQLQDAGFAPPTITPLLFGTATLIHTSKLN